MIELDNNKLRRLDLTLLLIFLGIIRHGKASQVALDLGVTAPSISHALGRLRDVFDDPLFLRRPYGLEPTAYALAIEPDIRRAVDALQVSLAGPQDFDPALAKDHLRISARDHEIASTLPKVICKLLGQAPSLTISMQSMSSREATQLLKEGLLDLAIGFFSQVHDEIEQTHLRTEQYLVVARAEHPIFRGRFKLADYLDASHLLVSTDTSMKGIVDDKLAETGLSRKVSLSLPHFMPALAVLNRSDLIATLPARVASENSARFGLETREPPIELRSFDVKVLRHKRALRNQTVTWCLERIIEAV